MLYDGVWTQIKTTGKAEVTVSVAHARTVEQGIKRTKAAENVARRLGGLVGWSKLVVERQRLSPTMVKLTFTLLYETAL